MDRNLHTDDFERLLREKSDEFRMYPSKRIWYSIYNNIHPGRKWPSVVMSIVLITSLFLIGYLNTSVPAELSAGGASISSGKNVVISARLSSPYYYEPFAQFDPGSLLTGKEINKEQEPAFSANPFPDHSAGKISSPFVVAEQPAFKPNAPVTPGSFVNEDVASVSIISNETKTLLLPLPENTSSILVVNEAEKVSSQDIVERAVSPQSVKISNSRKDELASLITTNGDKKSDLPKGALSDLREELSKEDKGWIENYAMYNRPIPKKWAGKLTWEMYATPSVIYRQLKMDQNFGTTANSAPFVLPSATVDINNDVIQKPSFGLEAGVAIQYPILKGLKLKTGLQLNYTRYNSSAYHNTHPVATKLTMHDYTTNSTYELFRTTPYSNKTGLESVRLHNETYQVSIPLGVDLKVLGNENLQWNIGATIQPTLVLGGKSYLISSDRRNYVKESSMINRWNLNAGFETYISYKANGITYQVGPQFRSQLFSTNSKKFAIEERLVSYGIKFGVVKTLK